MDNFKVVYNILSALEKAMDLPEFDISTIGPKILGISDERFARYIEMMLDVGYIKGVYLEQDITGVTHMDATNIRITLKGLEYLQKNSIMRKIYKTAKGIKEITPSL